MIRLLACSWLLVAASAASAQAPQFHKPIEINPDTVKAFEGISGKLCRVTWQYGRLVEFDAESKEFPPAFRFEIFPAGDLPDVGIPFAVIVDGSKFDDAALKRLAKSDKLSALKINSNAITDAGVEALAGCRNLRWLEIDCFQVTAKSIGKIKGLTALGLNYYPEEMELAPIFELTQLRSLRLDRRLSDADAYTGIGKLRNLEYFDIPEYAVTDGLLASLARCGKLHTASWCQRIPLGDPDDLWIASRATCDAEINSVRIGGSHVTDAGLASLRHLTSLRGLSLHECPITGAGLKFLPCPEKLKDLQLSGTRVADLKCVSRFKNLVHLGVNRTDVGDDSLIVVKNLRKLKFVGLDKTKVTPAAFKKLSEIRPGIEMYYRVPVSLLEPDSVTLRRGDKFLTCRQCRTERFPCSAIA